MRQPFKLTLVSFCLLFTLNISFAQIEIDYRLIPTDCDYKLTAFLAGAGPDYSATYDWGDGTTSYADWAYVEHVYDQPGIYTVTTIHNGITYVEDVSIEDCGCPEAFEFINFDGQCNQMEIRLDTYLWSFGEYEVDWDFGDGNGYTSGTYPVGYNTYETEGIYNVTAYFTGPGCEDGITISTAVEVDFCEGECYPYIEYYFDETSCTYFAYNETGPEDSAWYLDGELFTTGNWIDEFTLPEGDHELCCIVEPNNYCPFGQTTCFDIDSPSCNEPCDLSLEYEFSPDECGVVNFELIGNLEITNQFVEVYGPNSAYEFPLPDNQNFSHAFGDSGDYLIVIPGAGDCEDVELELFIPDCQQCFMPVTWIESGCQTIDFFVSFTSEFIDFMLFTGDGNVIYLDGSTLVHTYEEPGTYVAYYSYYSLECQTIISNEMVVEVSPCGQDCSFELWSNEIECQVMEFEIDSASEVSEVTWDLGFGEPFTGAHYQVMTYPEPGEYEVCYSYFCAANQLFHENCQVIYVEGCEQECPEIFINYSECLTAGFSFSGAFEGIFHQWTVMYDGEIIQTYEGNSTTEISFPSEGLYHVGVSDALNCDGLSEPYFISVEIEDCVQECAEIIASETAECGVFEFHMVGDIFGNAYCWEVWGNDYFNTYFDGESTLVEFPGSGTYYLTVTNAELCDEQDELLYEIYIPECEEECDLYFTAVQESCSSSILSVIGNVDIEWFTFLYDGDYYEIYNGTAFDFGSPGDVFIDIIEVEGYACVTDANWNVWVGLDESLCQDNCELEIFAEEADNAIFVFTAEASDPEAAIFWEIEGLYLEGQILTYQFATPGIHEVCVFYETPNCPYGVQDCLEVLVLPEECPEITYEFTDECYVLDFEYSGLIDGPWYCWDAIGEDYFYSYFDEESTTIEFPGPGTYEIGVTNAILCPELDSYFITVVIPECQVECEGYIEMQSQNCGHVLFEMPSSASQIFIAFGDNTYETDLSGSVHDHQYEFPGEYEVCTEYFDLECQQWVGFCVTIFVEDCDEDCDFEIEVESLGNNTYVFYATVEPGTWTNWNIDGISHFNQNPITYVFDEEGDHEVCFEMETDFCNSSEDCFIIPVVDSQECDGVIISLEGLVDGGNSWLQSLECVLSYNGNPFWEDILSLDSENNLESLDLCLPEGCYTFSITNADPLILTSLIFLVQDTEGIDFDFELDLLENSASVSFGVGVECENSIDDQYLNSISFYPNPAQDQLQISDPSSIERIEITDLQGKRVYSLEQNIPNTLDLDGWSEGIYMLNYLRNQKWESVKIQILH